MAGPCDLEVIGKSLDIRGGISRDSRGVIGKGSVLMLVRAMPHCGVCVRGVRVLGACLVRAYVECGVCGGYRGQRL